MNPQSIVLAMALLTAGAPSYGQAVTPGGQQDFESIMKSMQKAQAEASQPGDEQLTCPQLQEQLVVIAQDPAFVAHVKAAGIAAEQDIAQMQVSQGEIAAKSAATIMASTVPGAAMGHMTASAAENQAKVAQGAARMQSRMAQGMQMVALMPKLMRGQRLIELATARHCEWTTGVGVPSIPNG
jgi:hypothetical protein